jgi:PKD repeat protein
MAWDLSGSYAPGDTISSYAIDFGDSNDDTGQSGSHTYAAAGTYTVTSTIVTNAGLSITATDEVNVIDCSDPLLLDYIYATTDGSGVFYFE